MIMNFQKLCSIVLENKGALYIVSPVLDCGFKRIKANTHDEARKFGIAHGLSVKQVYDQAVPKFLLSNGKLISDRKQAFDIADNAGQLQPWYDAVAQEESIIDKEEYMKVYKMGLQSQMIDFDIVPSFLDE